MKRKALYKIKVPSTGTYVFLEKGLIFFYIYDEETGLRLGPYLSEVSAQNAAMKLIGF